RMALTDTTRLKGLKIPDIAREGAHAEDDGRRPLNHFYDPLNESALVFASGDYDCLAEGILAGDFNARQWATITPLNEFGLAAAKQHLIDFITGGTSPQREQAEVDLFTALGHMMH